MVLSKGGQGGWWMLRARREGDGRKKGGQGGWKVGEGREEGGKEGVAKYRSQSMTADNEI